MEWPLVVLAPAVALGVLWLVAERGHLMLPSTRRALQRRRGPRAAASVEPTAASAERRGGVLNALHGYVYGRWTSQYIRVMLRWVLPRLSDGAKRAAADRYHGKVLPTELACAIVRLDHDIPRTRLDQVIPYPIARDIVLTASPNLVVYDCPCRRQRANPCTPTDVCLLVGGGDFVLDHQPHRARRVTQEEAVALLEAEHARGHVHTAYFKDACDDRFYAICNCCSCCCGGLDAMRRHGVPMVASSGYVAHVDEGCCIACGDCEQACPFHAVTVAERAVIDWEACMGCGVCEGQCATEAIALRRDERKGVPLDVRVLGVA